jgi:hypothetical protein
VPKKHTTKIQHAFQPGDTAFYLLGGNELSVKRVEIDAVHVTISPKGEYSRYSIVSSQDARLLEEELFPTTDTALAEMKKRLETTYHG